MGGLETAMGALWQDARPRVLARIATIEEAGVALAAGDLNSELAARAREEAHKLAGALGTFGLPGGSDHARAVEQRLQGSITAAHATELVEHARALRALVESDPSPASVRPAG